MSDVEREGFEQNNVIPEDAEFCAKHDMYKRLKNQVFSTTGCKVNDAAIGMIILWGAQQAARQAPASGEVETVAHPCWSCGEPVSFAERTNNDGDCPHCGVELHTDDWPVRAQGGQGAEQIMATLEHTEPKPVGYLHNRPERIPCFFETLDDARLSGCEVVPVYTQPQPAVPEANIIIDRVVEELENGFVRCERCGDQEDTATLDCMTDLKRLQALLTTSTPATTLQSAQQGSVPEIPSNEEFERLYRENHDGHIADFAADVLERWGGWPEGVLGYGGSATRQTDVDGWIEPDLMWDAESPEESCRDSAFEFAEDRASDMPSDETMVVNVMCAKMLPNRQMKIWIDDNDDLQWAWIETDPQPPREQEGE